MTLHFEPDKHKRIRRLHEERNKTEPTHNQPQPKVYSIFNYVPKPNEKLYTYFINPQRKISFEEIQTISKKLAEYFGVDLLTSEYFYNQLTVYLTAPVLWRDIEKTTLKVLSELDDS